MVNTAFPMIADPERALVLVHAPAERRPALAALWAVDERLASIVANARESMIGEIRLAWWRDSLAALDRSEPPAEPLLRVVAAEILPLGVSGAELAAMEEGWAALLEADPPDAEAIARHGRLRGRQLFALAARLLAGSADDRVAMAGEGWALADLGHRLRDPEASHHARTLAAERLGAVGRRGWPRPLRPLGALAALARRDAARPTRQQGAPGRIARLLLHRITGR